MRRLDASAPSTHHPGCGQNCMASSSRVSGTEYYDQRRLDACSSTHHPGCRTVWASSLVLSGTEYYDQGSPVCVAALHSGAINTNGGVFTITRSYSSATPRLYGSARNRILSNSMTSQGLFVYKIEKTQATVTEADLSEDVVVVHNSYTQDRNSCPYDPVKSRACCTVLVACLSQGSTSPRLVGWDFAERSYINTAARYQSSSPTVRFSKGQQMTIPLVKRPSTLPNTVYTRRLPDKWTSSTSDILPLMWSQAELYH
ncbi:putative LCCL domain-containing protein [Homarus americanus]|uniref:Putative LCCL domain-containing protein n=1 Tax=Homarus americanus TaxID=6706 RepID=A0A8J5TNK6_HOMAM|nr:putative LCCL domain-containing protein [Homarus americanus]